MKFLRSIKEFLHPLWRDSYKTDYNSNKTELNQTILDIFDEQLHKVEDETIASKSQSFLKTASDEWLDFWGSWFGLRRKKGQDDESYRQDILEHVKHARSTIPGLRTAISKFLHTSINNVQIYEPFNDVFLLNDPKSKLNTNKYLYGEDYYREALIDIEIGVPAPPELIDIINWFRPAGVLWLITYRPSLGDAQVWEASPLNAHLETELITLDYLIGLSKHLALNLTPDSKFGDSVGSSQPFILNDSLLNSTDLILGGSRFSSQYYGSVGSLNGLITPEKNDTLSDISKQYDLIPYKDTSLLAKRDNNNYPFSINKDISHVKNLLTDTYDFNNWETHVGIVPHAQPWEDNAQILEIKTVNSQIVSSNVPNLQVGQDYTFSVMARFSQKALPHDAALYVTVDNFKTKLLVTQKLSTNWSVYSVSFTFRNNLNLSNLIFWVEGTLETASSIQVSHFMLNEGKTFQPWSKSVLDYQATLEPDYTYIYGAFNFRDFFYDKVLDEALVKNFLGQNVSSETINKYIAQYLQRKELSLSYKALSPESTKVSIMMYNFATGFWVPLQTKSSFNEKIILNLSLKNLDQFLNDQGVLVLALKANTLLEPYLFLLDDLQIKLDRTVKDFAFQMYGEGSTDLMTLVYNMFLGTDTAGNSLGEKKSTPELYDRFEEHYPVRYIRTFTKGIYKGIGIVSQDLDDSDSYDNSLVDYYIEPTVNKANSDFPTNSLSVVGASLNDGKNLNILGNLLPARKPIKNFLSDWQTVGSEITVSPVNLLADKLVGYRLLLDASMNNATSIHADEVYKESAVIDSGSDLIGQGIKTQTYNAFSRSQYRFKFFAKSNNSLQSFFKVRISLLSNGFKYEVSSEDLLITSDLNYYQVDFDTKKVYPDTIEISLTSSSYENIDVSIFNTELVLNAQGSFNTQTDVPVPGIVPKRVDVLFKDFLGTTFRDFVQPNILTFSALDGLTFDDFTGTRFSNLRKLLFKDFLGALSFRDLVFDEGKLPQVLLDNGYYYDSELDVPSFTDLLNKADSLKQDQDIRDLLDYLQNYIHYKHSQGLVVFANKLQDLLDKKLQDFLKQGKDFSAKEQCFTLDLGKVHTDLRYLTLFHGSNSYPNALYTVCLQTSVDGKHWTTWYDNYRGDKSELDAFYPEKNSMPRKFKLPLYNSLQSRIDEPVSDTDKNLPVATGVTTSDVQETSAKVLGIHKNVPEKDQSHTFIINQSLLNSLDLIADSGKPNTSSPSVNIGKPELPTYYKLPLYSSVLSIYPSYELKDLVFGKLADKVQEITLGNSDVLAYHSYFSKYLASPTSIIDYLVQTGVLKEKPHALNPRSFNLDFTFDPTTKKLTPFKANRSLLNGADVLSGSEIPSSSLNTDNNNSSSNSPDSITDTIGESDEIKNPFIINQSLLNGTDLILNGHGFIPSTVPDIKQPAKKGYLLEQHLLSVNVVERVTQRFAYLWQNLNITSLEEKVAVLKYYLMFNQQQLVFQLKVSASAPEGWNFATWNSTKNTWNLVNFTKEDGLQTLTFSVQDVVNCLSLDGCIYFMVYQTVLDDTKQDVITSITGQGTLNLLLDNINSYNGGLYPHKNYLVNTPNHDFLQVTKDKPQSISYSLPDELLGKNIVISFNGFGDKETYGKVSLSGAGLDATTCEEKMICPYSQHYEFNVQTLTKDLIVGKPQLTIQVQGDMTSFLLTALKVEIGVEATPYH